MVRPSQHVLRVSARAKREATASLAPVSTLCRARCGGSVSTDGRGRGTGTPLAWVVTVEADLPAVTEFFGASARPYSHRLTSCAPIAGTTFSILRILSSPASPLTTSASPPGSAAFGDGRQGLPVSATLDCFVALVGRKLSRPPELGARSHSQLPAFSSAFTDHNSRPCELDVSQSGSPSVGPSPAN